MKLDMIKTIITVALAGLTAFGFFVANEDDTYRILITIGSGLSVLLTLGGFLALASPNHGLMVNLKIVSCLFFIVLLIVHIIFSIAGIYFPAYIIITGVLIVIYLLVSYSIIRAIKN